MKGTKKLVVLALFVSQALVLSIIESFIPIPVGIPGIKLGLANIITMILIMHFGLKETLAVVVVRCLLSSIFGGGLVIFLFSVAGGILSALVMYFLNKRMSRFLSVVGISISGAVAHNIGQVLVAVVILQTSAVLSYLPVLMVSGIIMGCFVGFCSMFLSRAIEKTNILQ
mgnify:FL=1